MSFGLGYPKTVHSGIPKSCNIEETRFWTQCDLLAVAMVPQGASDMPEILKKYRFSKIDSDSFQILQTNVQFGRGVRIYSWDALPNDWMLVN